MFRVTILSLFFISFSQIKSSDTGTPSPITAELIKIMGRVSCDESEVVAQKYEEKCRQLLNQKPMTVTTSPQVKQKEKEAFIKDVPVKRMLSFADTKRKGILTEKFCQHAMPPRYSKKLAAIAELAKGVAEKNGQQRVSIRGAARLLSPVMYPAPIVYPE